MTHPSPDRRPPTSLAALVALLTTWAGCAACGNGCSGNTAAVVTHVEAAVERDRTTAIETWEAAAVGDAISMGEAVRTQPTGRATLELTAGGGLRMGPSSMVRFGARPEGDEAQTLAWPRGEIEVETNEALIISTEFGAVRLEGGTHVSAVLGQGGVRMEVIVGLAVFADGTRVTAGGVFDGRTQATAAAAAPTAPPARAQGGQRSPSGTEGLDGGVPVESGPRVPGIERYEFSVAAGAGGVIHHPSPPAVVGIHTGCPDGEVEVDSDGTTTTYAGGTTVGVRMARGPATYEVRCAGQPPVTGRFTVTADSGRRRLNTRSQQHTVAADGRRYTFLYEQSLPTLSLRWNNAPAADEYTVNLTGTRRVTRLTSATPSATVPRSALREGAMTFQFSGGGRQSPRTTITVQHDAASPTAALEAPPDGGFAGGSTVTVSGTAQLGSQVLVGGQRLEVDGRGAFSGTASAEGGGLAVQITTPSQGNHYFVRRAAGQ